MRRSDKWLGLDLVVVGLMVFIVAVMIQVVLEGEVFNSMEKVIQ